VATIERSDLTGYAGVDITAVEDRDDIADALDVLERAERTAIAPLVDEAERVRLEAAADGSALTEHHHAVLARRGERCLGYAGLVVPPADTHGTADVAVPRGETLCDDVLRALLGAVDELARVHHAHGTRVWIREATSQDVVDAIAAGYAVERRLGVLGLRVSDQVDAVRRAAGDPDLDVTIRPVRPEEHDAVVALLDAAYRDTADGPWDRERFDDVVARGWHRDEDLLVAVDDDGTLLGVHWTKRRSATQGEVHNLAVAPEARGRQLGRALLRAGVAHLAEVGCQDVLLWVDLANEAAVRLYVTAGFATRWEDIALIRHVGAVREHSHRGEGAVH
jgi:mycothiol synthase